MRHVYCISLGLLFVAPASAQVADVDPNAMAVGVGIAINNMAQYAVRQKNRADQIQEKLDVALKESAQLKSKCGKPCEASPEINPRSAPPPK